MNQRNAARNDPKFNRRRRVMPVLHDRRGPGSRLYDPVTRAAASTVRAGVYDTLELRQLMAAHIVGSNVNYATIQGAVDAAQPGATITVDAGTYNGQVTINKTLRLLGANAGRDARGSRGAESVLSTTRTGFMVKADNVTIDGFTVLGTKADVGAALVAGVQLAPSIEGSKVLNNIIRANVTGLYLSNDSDTNACVIRNNWFDNNHETNEWYPKGWNGSRQIYTDGEVSGGYLSNVWIDANRFTKSENITAQAEIGLEAQGAGKQFNITITNNTFDSQNWYGAKAVLVFNTTNLTIVGNEISGHNDVSSGGLRFEGNDRNVVIAYNTIRDNSGPGIVMDASGVPGKNANFYVRNNNITGNQNGSNKIGLISNAPDYDGTIVATGNYWGAANGPGGIGSGGGQAVWANASVTGHWTTPVGAAGGSIVFEPYATGTINIGAVPAAGAASGLAARAVSSSQVRLDWTASYTTAFQQFVQRSTDGVNFVTVATLSPLVQTYVDNGLNTGVAYTYRVVSSNNAGQSAPSNAAAATPPAYQPPSAPSNVAPASATATSITLTWSPPANAFGVNGYAIYRDGRLVAIAPSGATTYTDAGLSATTVYTYAIASVDNVGSYSAQSLSVRGTTAAPAAGYNQVTGTLIGTAGSWGNQGNTIAKAVDGSYDSFFDAPSADGAWVGYDFGGNVTITRVGFAPLAGSHLRMLGGVIQVSTTADFSSGVTTLHTINSTPDTFAMTFVNLRATGRYFRYLSPNGSYGNISELRFYMTPAAVPTTPTDVVAAGVSAPQARVAWDAPIGATPAGYLLQRSADGTNFTTVATLAGTATSYDDNNLSAGTNYVYRVIATYAAGNSAPSAAATARTFARTPISTPLSGVNWTSATSGWSVPKANTSVANKPMTIRGQTYASGIGTHANSTIAYDLAGRYTTFSGTVGIDDGVPTYVSPGVAFQVYGDGKLLYDSGVVGRNSSATSFAVSVAGVKTLTLVASSATPNSTDYCHADWAGVTLIAAPQAPIAPTKVVATPSATPPSGVGSVLVTWQGDGTQDNFIVQRSSDGGQTFANVATVSGSTLAYTDTGMETGKTYFYRVIASNSLGASPASAADDATVAKYVAPLPPAGVRVTTSSATSVTLAWAAADNAAGYVVYRNGVAVGNVTGGTTTSYVDAGVQASTSYQYTVATLDKFNAASAESSAAIATTAAVADAKLTGTVIGTAGSWNNSGNTIAKLFDGDLATFFDAATGDGTWAGLDLGSAKTLTQVVFAPRGDFNGRMIGGSFQVSDTADFSSGVTTVYTIPSAPAYGLTTVTLATPATGRYVRYLSPNGGFGNAAELQFVGRSISAPNAPAGVTATATGATTASVAWAAPLGPTPAGYLLQRSADGTTFTTIATLAAGVTSYGDVGLTASTRYAYRVIATNAAGSSAPSAAASVTTQPAATAATPISTLNWTSASSGWQNVQKDKSVKGTTITLRGKTYTTGLGANTDSTIAYDLAGRYTRFTADLGVDDGAGYGRGSVAFSVVADGKVIYTSGTLTGTSAVVSVDLDLTGVKTLQLVATNAGDGINYDQADWAGATLYSDAAAAPAAPTNLAANLTLENAVQLSWANASPAATLRLERSTDAGATWASVADGLAAGTSTYADATVQPGAAYAYRVVALNGTAASAPSNVATVKTVAADAVVTNLSTLTPTSAASGWGSVQVNKSVKGNPLTLAGKTYATGLGTHAPSAIEFNLNGAYDTFGSDVGLDDAVAGKAADGVVFSVVADGVAIWTSRPVTAAGQVQSFNVSVAGVQTLQLVVACVTPGEMDYGHADWAGARLTATPAAQTPVVA